MLNTYTDVLKKIGTDSDEVREIAEFSIIIRALPKEKRQMAEGFILGLAATESMTPAVVV